MWARSSGSTVRPASFRCLTAFAEMGGIPVNDDGGEEVEFGHAVVLALTALSVRGASIAHSTTAFPVSVRFCPLPESTRLMALVSRTLRRAVSVWQHTDRLLKQTGPAL